MIFLRFLTLLVLLSLLAILSLDAEEVTRLDRYGDLVPEQALARLGTIRFRHGGGITCLSYFPDGKFLASGRFDNRIRLWDAQIGRLITLFEGHLESIRTLVLRRKPRFKLQHHNI
jgi:WD40 repeat protein